MAVDVVVQGARLVQSAGASSSSFARGARAARSAFGPPVQRQLTVPGSWVQRYGGDGAKLDDAGVSQGVVDDEGRGHERSLVGFDLAALPPDANVAIVRLRVRWETWRYFNGVGSLVLGWHDQPAAPVVWTVGAGVAQLSAFDDVRQEVVDLVLEWANPPMGARTFGGLAVGPGFNDSPLYAGTTSVDPTQWELTVTHLTAEQEEGTP